MDDRQKAIDIATSEAAKAVGDMLSRLDLTASEQEEALWASIAATEAAKLSVTTGMMVHGQKVRFDRTVTAAIAAALAGLNARDESLKQKGYEVP